MDDFLETKFKFSIIMAVFNTEKYLYDAIDSIINQTLDFKNNIQLILVNDGSDDNSLFILEEYQKRFPENIIILNQKNSGQAIARNNGLKHVRSKYINFLDSDDYLESNALEEVWNFFESHPKIDIVSIPIQFFSKKQGSHMLNDKFNESKVIDLIKDPNNPQLSASSSFFRKNVFNKYLFDTNVLFSEDSILINKILLDNPFLGVINTTNYFYRKRFDSSSTMDNVHLNKEYFLGKIKNYFLYLIEYSKLKNNNVPKFLKYTLIYDFQWIFYEDISILDDSEKSEFWSYLYEFLEYVDDEIILSNKFIRNDLIKMFIYCVKKRDFHFEYVDNDVLVKSEDFELVRLSNYNFWIDIVDFDDEYLNISGAFNSLIDRKFLSIQAIVKNNEGNIKKFPSKFVNYTLRKDISFLSKTFQFKNCFDLQIPISECEESIINIVLNFHKDGNNQNFLSENVISFNLNINFLEHTKLSKLSNYKISDNILLFFKNNSFYLSSVSCINIARREVSNIYYIIKDMKNIPSYRIFSYVEIIFIRLIYFISIPFFKRFNDIYLFEDRINIADDNAFYLFKYANSIPDDIKKYFVLSKQSKDYTNVSEYGKVLSYGSFKHKLISLHTKKIISTHPYESQINPFWDTNKNQRHLVAGLLNYKLYFLQHGVTKDNISTWLSKFDKNLSLIVTVSDMESNAFLEEGYGFDKKIIQNLGFPRFDYLNDNTDKQILFVPTWRNYLKGDKLSFINSNYYKSINSFIKNKYILNLIKKGYKIIFRPHPELMEYIGETNERYIDLFDIPKEIIVSHNDSYQELFNSSSLLITDFSSVFFDFAYLKKPIIYYQPNDDYHYIKSYFNYETMGFGRLVKSESELIELLLNYIRYDCKMENEYTKRVDDFFTHMDKNNSKRVYDWILKH